MEIFIEKAKLIHGDKYDYSLVEYKNNYTNVDIICNKCTNGKIHGVFPQTPKNHLNGHGCPVCGKEQAKQKLKSSNFIEKANLVHGDKYDYSLVEYKNNHTKVNIICHCETNRIEHGVFPQTPNDHLKGSGCPVCAKQSIKRTKTTEQFIKDANLVHGGKYDYSLVEYVNAKTPVKIICRACGNIFEQKPNDHLSGCGCSNCNFSKGEEIIKNILVEKEVEFISQKKYKDLKDDRRLSYDFYIPSKNLLIEFNGKQHYLKNCFRRSLHDWHKQLHHDWMKRKYAKLNKINLLIIPYWEFDNIKEILENSL